MEWTRKVSPRAWRRLAWAAVVAVVISPVVMFAVFLNGMQSAEEPVAWIRHNIPWFGLIAFMAFVSGGILLTGVVFGVNKVISLFRPDKGGGLAARVRGGALSVAFLPLLTSPFITDPTQASSPPTPYVDGAENAIACAVVAAVPMVRAGLGSAQGLDQTIDDCGTAWDYCEDCSLTTVSIRNLRRCISCGYYLGRCLAGLGGGRRCQVSPGYTYMNCGNGWVPTGYYGP